PSRPAVSPATATPDPSARKWRRVQIRVARSPGSRLIAHLLRLGLLRYRLNHGADIPHGCHHGKLPSVPSDGGAERSPLQLVMRSELQTIPTPRAWVAPRKRAAPRPL